MEIRNFIISLLRIIGILLGLFILLIGVLLLYASIDKVDSFFISGAEFDNSGWLYEMENHSKIDFKERRKYIPVYAHRLKIGKGIVFGFREYSNGNILAIDDETFRKLTIWVAAKDNLSPHAELDLANKEKVLAIYSNGASAWPATDCAGFIKTGSVSLDKMNGSFNVRLSGIFVPIKSQYNNSWCNSQHLDLKFTASSIEFSALTPWLGKAGEHPYSETYR